MHKSTARPARRGRPFQKGSDPRRHIHTATCGHQLYKFTAADCSAGFFAAIATLGVSIGDKLQQRGRWPGYHGRH